MYVKQKTPKGKIALLLGVGASVGYSYLTHDDRDFVKLGFNHQVDETWSTVRKYFGVYYTAYNAIATQFGGVYKYFADPPKEKLLPDIPQPHARRMLTLVIDLDQTLTYTTWSREKGHITRRRPYTKEFLRRMINAGAEIVVFGNAVSFVTAGIAQALDPRGEFISAVLAREHMQYVDGRNVKDLSKLNRDMSRVLLLDDDPECFYL